MGYSVDAEFERAHLLARRVAEHFRMKESILRGPRKHANVAWPRQIAMYLIRTSTTLSFPEIGTLFGGRDHTTVIYGVNRVRAARAEDATLDGLLRSLGTDA